MVIIFSTPLSLPLPLVFILLLATPLPLVLCIPIVLSVPLVFPSISLVFFSPIVFLFFPAARDLNSFWLLYPHVDVSVIFIVSLVVLVAIFSFIVSLLLLVLLLTIFILLLGLLPLQLAGISFLYSILRFTVVVFLLLLLFFVLLSPLLHAFNGLRYNPQTILLFIALWSYLYDCARVRVVGPRLAQPAFVQHFHYHRLGHQGAGLIFLLLLLISMARLQWELCYFFFLTLIRQ